jgi:hypothetical protein
VIGIDFGGSSSDDEENSLFINHLKKCFIAIDDDRFCEYILLPEIERANKAIKENGHKESRNKVAVNELSIEEKKEFKWKKRFSNYIDSKSYDYLKNISKFLLILLNEKETHLRV